MTYPRLTRRAAIGAGLAASLAPAGLRAADLSGITLRVATYKGQNKTMLPAAHVDDTPYKVVYSEFAGGNLIVEAMNADAIDLGSWSEIPTAFAAAAHANVRATTSQYYLLKMLHQVGLSFADITPVSLGVADGQAAFRSGGIDAWAIYGYPIYFAQAQDGARVLRTALGVLSGNYHIGLRPALLRDAPVRAAIADYLGRLQRAYDWSEANRAEWSATLSATIGVPPRFVRAALDGESQKARVVGVDAAAIASCQDVADVFAAGHMLPGHVDVAPYFDTSFNASLARI